MVSQRSYNVLQVLPELDAGGVERTTVEVADALVQAGHGAFVVSGGGRLVPRLLKTGATHFTARIGSKRLLSFPWRVAAIRKLIVLNGIDIVHARSRAPAWAAWRAALAEGVPFVTTYHGIYNEGVPGKRRYNSIMARGDRVIANSRFTADHVMATHKTPEARIRVVHRGVDMALFDPAAVPPARVEAVWRTWGVSPEDRVVLLPGRLTRWKGQIVAIEALGRLPGDWVLVCAGDAQGRDAYERELRELAQRLGVADRLRLPGHETDMPAALLAADRVITPSTDPEAFGRTAAEAQAMGRWVV
ncbi:MAG: glycosyltransferase family 4 protein, partial [Litorimonas sp.]